MKKRILSTAFVALGALMSSFASEAVVLKGTTIGSDLNEAAKCFDGNASTYFRGYYSYNNSYVRNWAGLDLGEPHVISRIGLRAATQMSKSARLAVVQGANSSDFTDAVTIQIFKEAPSEREMTYLDVETSRGFRYVRVVASGTQGCFAEIEFEGEPGEGDSSKFFQITNLPTVTFNTLGQAEIKSKDDKHAGSYVAIVSDDGTKILEDASAQMKGRGNGSWTFPKKPFQIKFNKKQQPLDAPAKAKKWTLINNYGDRTLMRNKVAFEISREVGMDYTPYCTFVDVVYNGSYEGAYQLCDQVEVGSGRVELTEMSPEDVAGEALSGGYFIEIDAYADQEISWFTSAKGTPVTIKSPDDDEIVGAQSAYIRDYFNKMEAALYSDDFTDEEKGYRKYLDLESFLRYFIVCELDGNQDSFWSVYMWKDRGDEKFRVGPVWDIDLGFQNCGTPYPVNSMTDYLYTHKDASKANGMEQFVSRIVKEDAGAREQLSEMWSQLRHNGNLNYDYFDRLIDSCASVLDESQTLNFVRWPILNQSVQKNQKVYGSYAGEVGNIKSYLQGRFPKLDEWMDLHDVAAIGSVITDGDNNAAEEYFDLQGRRVDASNMSPGFYIRRHGSQTEKILVR